MSSEMVIDGKAYIPSREAATETGYTQDYIGQLARAGSIDARRIGGLWYVFLDSLNNYKKQAESYVPVPPGRQTVQDVDSFVSFDGQDYISAARAAEITGYAQDYVGQLAREGIVLGRQVGSRWYVDRESILKHKKEKDSLLGAVQSESVGIIRRPEAPETNDRHQQNADPMHFTYVRQENDLMPILKVDKVMVEERLPEGQPSNPTSNSETETRLPIEETPQSIPIRLVEPQISLKPNVHPILHQPRVQISPRTPIASGGSKTRTRSISMALSGAAVLLVIISAAYISFRSEPILTLETANTAVPQSNVASANQAGGILEFIERLVAPEIVYMRSRSASD